MEKSRICKICNKTFASGKAMGGHMRSHMAKLPIPSSEVRKSTKSWFPSKRREDESRRFRLRNHGVDLYRSVSSLSESDSPKNPTRTRSKRSSKSMAELRKSPLPPPRSVSSVSDAFTSVEDVAMCLIMLSRDQWNRNGEGEDETDVDVDEFVESENSEDDSFDFSLTRSGTRYKCETCNKLFGSYQALGGHRGSHKKVKFDVVDEYGNSNVDSNDGIDQRVFECPFCNKVFDSGQALGGHKKVHLSKARINEFDLNLPAPEYENEEDSQLSFQHSP